MKEMKTNATALSVLVLAYCIPCACSFQQRPVLPPPLKAARSRHQKPGNSASPENVTHEGGVNRCFRTAVTRKRCAAMHLSSVDKSEELIGPDQNDAPVGEREKLFQRRLEQLAEFVSVHGHGSIPTPYDDDPSLGVWAANIRRQYVLRIVAEDGGEGQAPYAGYLTPSRISRLKRAGFDFLSLTEAQFRLRLAELEEFKEKYGHCMVPQHWDDNPGLGMWVLNIRKLYKKLGTEGRSMPRFSHLSDERIKLLTEMGFVWNLDDHRWLTMLEWAKVYGAVSRHLYMSNGGSVSRDDDQININREELEERYRLHVDEILDQGAPTVFRRQEDILSLLTGDESHSEAFAPSFLHYSVSPSDDYHRPLRNWMTSQRSFHKSYSTGDATSETNKGRRETLESIHFPWSGRFPNLIEEVRHRERREAEARRLREVEERRRKREIEELERINKILTKPIEEDDGVAVGGSMRPEDQKKLDDDLMALWGAEDDDDGEW